MFKSRLLFAALTLIVTGCSNSTTAPPTEGERLRSEQAKLDARPAPAINVTTRFAAGQLAEAQGDADRAIDQYKEALKLDPQHTPTLFRLGMAYTARQQYPEAIDIWKRYIAATDGSATGQSNLGFCLEISGELEKAEAAYRAGIAKEPKNQVCRVNYGLMLARQGRLDEATQQLQAVLSPAEVHYNLASVLEFQGHKEQAKAQYLEAIKIDPDMSDARQRLAALN